MRRVSNMSWWASTLHLVSLFSLCPSSPLPQPWASGLNPYPNPYQSSRGIHWPLFRRTVSTLPEQIHLGLGEKASDVAVMWATYGPGKSASVLYGTMAGNLSLTVPARMELLYEGNSLGCKAHYRAVIRGRPGAVYYYRVQTDRHQSPEFSFRAMADGTDPLKLVVYGDMGRIGGSYTLRALEEEAASGQYDAFFHAGDFAYNMNDNGGSRADKFMNRIQPITARVPYLVVPGNHERYDNFGQYRHRFSLPGLSNGKSKEIGDTSEQHINSAIPTHTQDKISSKASMGHSTDHPKFRSDKSSLHDRSVPNTLPSPWPIPMDHMWWSTDLRHVHIIGYSTEVFFYTPQYLTAQRAWLEQDLQKANLPTQRQAHPWIIAVGHRPMYCSNTNRDDCTKGTNGLPGESTVRRELEELFYKYGVDLVIQAHEHSYERFWPVFQGNVTARDYKTPSAPVHVVSGSAGCNEAGLVCADVFLTEPGPWSAYRAWLPGMNGYGRLTVWNETHLQWEQTASMTGEVIDRFTIVQPKHSMRTL